MVFLESMRVVLFGWFFFLSRLARQIVFNNSQHMRVEVAAGGLFAVNSVEARLEVVVKMTGPLRPSLHSCAFLPYEGAGSSPVGTGLEASRRTSVH